MPPKATINEIAKQLGVSIATVSRALNDQPGVSQEVRENIIKVANDLGYKPNLHARRLATSITRTVGFVISKRIGVTDDPFYPVIMSGAEDYFSQQDYHLLITMLDEKITQPPQLPIISRGLVDGLILAGPFIPAAFITDLLGGALPFVLIDNGLAYSPVNCVLNDDEGSGYASTRHLLGHGHKRIVYLSGPMDWITNQERSRGYRRAMEEAGLEECILRGNETSIASGEILMNQALERWPDLTAVCAVNDAVAIGAIKAAAPRGRKIPDDIAVMGFDDISWASSHRPPLSTVRVDKQRIGYLAAQSLINCINHPGMPPVKTLVSTEMVLRDSCGCSAGSS